MTESLESAFVDVCRVFGIAKLSTYQEDAIKYVVNEKKDVFVNLPTGFGKSIIFQALPQVFNAQAQILYGRELAKHIIIVVSPLNSLIKDQVTRLNSLGVNAVALSDITSDCVKEMVLNGDYSIVFGSPELWLGDDRWRKMVSSDIYRNTVRAVAVDEAHIVCHWYVLHFNCNLQIQFPYYMMLFNLFNEQFI